ncbi:tandem-95 repeat protein, partial [Magnetospirillum sp. 64-120]|uniref:tandem-95 repeat protein n=1 Tax=Magnetospirillum sp. 64-120 TaxID=1895778 RepID=UPI000A9DBF84
MADENLNDAPEENANPNGAPSENAQQALDDLTVLSDVGNQSMGDSKLNLVRNVDLGDAALGGLANVHQGSGTGNQVQQGLEVQAGLIQAEEIVVEQAAPTPVEPPEVPPTEVVQDETASPEIVDTEVKLGIQEDLSVANVVFGDGIPTEFVDNGDVVADAPAVEQVVEEVVQDVIPAATLEDTFVDSQPVFGGILIDVPGDGDPSLVPVPTPLDWTEDKTLTFGIDASDPDGGEVVISFLQPEHGTVSVNADGTYSYEPTQDYFGQDSFTVFVTDDEGNVVSQVVDLNIANVEDEAVITVTGGTGTESDSDAATVVTGQVLATDADNLDGSAVSFSFGIDAEGNPILTQPTAHGTVTIDAATGEYTFTATDNNWSGSDHFTVTTTDSQGGTTTFDVPVTVVASDDQAVFTVTGGEGFESTSDAATVVTGSVGATDTDGAVTYSFGTDDNGDPITTLVTDHGSVTIDPNTGAYTFTASDNNWAGSDSFTVVTTDPQGGTSSVDVPVTVTEVDDATVVTGPTAFGMNEDGTITLTPEQLLGNASDIDSTLSVANV